MERQGITTTLLPEATMVDGTTCPPLVARDYPMMVYGIKYQHRHSEKKGPESLSTHSNGGIQP